MAERIARLTLTLQGWTGWSREQPAPQTVAVEARRGQVLGPADFGLSGAELDTFNRIFGCRVRVMTLLEDRAVFEHQRLVVVNPNGTINLSAPATGSFLLKPGQRIDLATPTMDGGLHLSVALESVEEAPDPA
jgi:hypothetical protein